MTLFELTEPLFQFICCLNRSAKHGAHNYAQTRREIDDIFQCMRDRAEKDPSLIAQFQQIERPLVLFVDSIISTGPFGFAGDWNQKRLAYELRPPDLSGDQTFFELLEDVLHSRSEQAAEQVAVFYTCIGLGMKGMYQDQPEILRRKMQECAGRIRGMLEPGASKICPGAYENIDPRDIIPKDASPLWALGIALGVMVVGLFVANIVLYRDASSDLRNTLKNVAGSSSSQISGSMESKP